jgi:hypothetical protein
MLLSLPLFLLVVVLLAFDGFMHTSIRQASFLSSTLT